MACLSRSLWTGIESFPKKRLMIGRLLANLSFTSISSTSVGNDTKLNCCNEIMSYELTESCEGCPISSPSALDKVMVKHSSGSIPVYSWIMPQWGTFSVLKNMWLVSKIQIINPTRLKRKKLPRPDHSWLKVLTYLKVRKSTIT